jgi:hypothetical protein
MIEKTHLIANLKYILILLESSNDLNITEEDFKKLNSKSISIKKSIDKKLKFIEKNTI